MASGKELLEKGSGNAQASSGSSSGSSGSVSSSAKPSSGSSGGKSFTGRSGSSTPSSKVVSKAGLGVKAAIKAGANYAAGKSASAANSPLGRAPTYNEWAASKNPGRLPWENGGMPTNLQSPVGRFSTPEEEERGKYLADASEVDSVLNYLNSGNTDYATTKSYLDLANEKVANPAKPTVALGSQTLNWNRLQGYLQTQLLADNRKEYDKLSETANKAQETYDVLYGDWDKAHRSGAFAGDLPTFNKSPEEERLDEAKKVLDAAVAARDAWVPNTNERREELIQKMHSSAGLLRGGLTREEQLELLALDAELMNPEIDYGKDFTIRGDVAKGVAMQGIEGINRMASETANFLVNGLPHLFDKPAAFLVEHSELARDVDALAGEMFRPIKGGAEKLDKYVEDVQAADAERYAQNFSGDKMGEAINKYGVQVVEAIPMALLAFATGGTSAGLMAGENITELSALAQSSGVTGLAKAATSALKAYAKDPNFQLVFAQELGSSYDEAKADGANDLQATTYALMNAFANAGIEIGGGIQGLPGDMADAIKTGRKDVIYAYAKSIGEEVGEEIRQGAASSALKGAYKDVPLYSTEDEDAVINPNRMKEEAKGAAVVAAALGAPSTAANIARTPPRGSVSVKNGKIVVNNESGQEGYIARHAETEAYRRAEEQAQDIPQVEPQQVAIDNQAESATIDQAEANEMAQSQNATLEGQEKAPAPAPKKVSSPTGQTWHQLPNVIEDSPNAAIQKSKDGSYTVHLNIDSSSGRFRVFDTLDEARAFFNSVNNSNGMATSQAQTIEGQDTNPVQAPKNTEAATASETAQGEEQAQTQQETPENTEEAVKLEGNSQQEARRKSVPSSDPEEAARAEKNEERRQADNAQIDRAFNAKSPTTFQGTGSDPNATVIYDPNTRSLTVKDADGNVIDRITDLNKRRAKKELNKLRRTERATEAAPAPVETKAEAEQTAQQAEPQQESSAGESETAQQIRTAESVDQLRKMFFEDPDSFAEAYEEVTGEKLNQYTAPDDIADLYDRMHGETQEEEAPAAEEETETEETAPTLEQNLPEEQKPLRERIQSNAISDTELETMLGDRTSRNELAKALGITSTARKNVEAGYRLYQLLNSELNAHAEEVAKAEVLQQVKNGEVDSDDLRALIKSGKLTAEDVVSTIGRGGKDIRNLLGQYADYKNGLNPSSMTQADNKWLERANKKKAANAKTNEARKAAEAVSLEDQLKGEGVDEDNAGDALGESDSTGSVERSAPVGSDDTRTTKGSNGRNVGTLFEPLTGRKYDAAEQALNEEYERRGISGPEKDSLETIRNDGIERRSKKKIYILASNKVSKPYKTLLKIANKYGRNFLTIMDASESTDVGESGFCHRSTSIFGPTFITHRYIPQSARSFANLDGQSVSHEYAHDFGTVYAEEHDGNRPDYLEGLKSVTSDLVKTGTIQDDKQANMRNLLLRMYAQKVGPNAIRGYLYAKYKNQVNGREKFNEAFEAYAKLNGKDKVTYIKENLPDAYKTFTTTAREEIMMELCSEGQYFKTALQSAGYDIKPFGEAARSWLERDGGVPQGFFNEIAPVVEQLNQDNLKWLEEQDKIRGGNAAVTSSETDAGTLSEATDLRDAEIEDLKRRLAEAEARAEANAQPTAENPYAVNRYYPDGATDTRTNKRVSEMRTAGEKVHAGSVSYERVSKKQIADAAETNLRTFGYEHELKYFENTPPRHADALDIEEAAQLFTKLDVERSFRETHGGKARDTSLPADMDTLVSDAENLAQWVTEATGQAARVLCQTATLTPELKTLTNGRTTYLGNAEPGEVDPDSVGAKMYRIMDDHISYIQDIQDRLDRKEISREEATKEMLHELHEINVVRNVKKVFGKQGERMEQWEAKLLDRVAGSAQGYELLKAMAVGSVDRIASDFGTVGAINTVKQIRYLNLLSNFLTKVNNVLNNLESSTTGAISQNVGRALTNRVATDILDGDVPLAKDYSWQHGIGWGKNKELNRYMIDKGAESVLSLYYNLDVDEGVVDVDLGKSTARFNQNDGTFGRLMARLQFLSGLGMQTTDAMAIARSEKGMELGIDELGLSEARREVMKQDAQQEARRRMYHGETKAAKAMLALRDAANTIQIPFTSDKTGKIGLGDIMMPFVQVPTNVAMRAMRSSPLGVLYGFGKYATGINALKRKANIANRVKALEEKRSKKAALTAEEMQFLNDNKGVKAPTDAEVRSLQRTLGESCTNAAIMVFAAGLSALGAIRDFDDEDDEDMKRLAREKGYTGLQINLSALLNGGKWNDDGDVVIGGNWLEVMALPVAAGYSIFHSYNEDTNGGADVFKAVAMSPFSSLTQLLDAAEEIPGIKQASEIWNAYENLQQYDSLDKRISKSWAGITQYSANTASSFVIPNLVAQFAAGRDNTVRDIYNADTSLEVAKNIIQNKVPWWRDQLPEAKSSLGETRKYGENKAMGLLNRMILPGTGVQIYRKSALEKEYEALGKSGNGNVAAKTSAPTAIKIDGQEWPLNADERRKYDEMYTPLVRQYHEQLINSDYYKELPAELKQEALQDTRSLAERLTKEYTLRNKDGCEAEIDFKNWERAVSNNPEKAVEFELAKMGAKACYTKEELTDFKAMDHYLDTEYKKLDPELKDVLDASYARLDSMADAREKTGMSSEQYETFRKLWKSYDDAVKNKTEDDESYSGFNRNLIVDIYDDPNATEAQKAWAADNFRLWMNTPAKLDSPQKIVKNTSLSWKEADEWLDLKANTKPAEGYKELPQNQRLMMVRDSSFPESKKWELIEVEASDSAWAKLKPFKDEGKSVAYALEHGRWYKATRYSNYKAMRFDTIYPND